MKFEYELLYDGKGGNGTPFVPGLIDVHRLKDESASTTEGSRGEGTEVAGASRSHHGVNAGSSRTVPSAATQGGATLAGSGSESDTPTRLYRSALSAASYLHPTPSLAAAALGEV